MTAAAAAWSPYRVLRGDAELVRISADGIVTYGSEADLVEAMLIVSGWAKWAATRTTSSSSITPDAPS